MQDLSTKGNNADDAIKINVCHPATKEKYEAEMFTEAAKRVVWKNCNKACEVDEDRYKNFNREFYYNMPNEQKCLQSCYNMRMIQHFGIERASTTD